MISSMRCARLLLVLVCLAAVGAPGVVRIQLENTSASASSTTTLRDPMFAVNGAGLSGSMHTNVADYAAWQSALQTSTVSGQWFRVDLGRVVPLAHVKLWNFNFWYATGSPTNRGVREAEVYLSCLDTAPGTDFEDASRWTRVIDKVAFAKAPGANTYSGEPEVSLQGLQGRWLALRVLSNHSTTDYRVGISELQVFQEETPVSSCMPTGVRAWESSATTVEVKWSAPTNAAGVVGYRIFRDGIPVGTSVTTNFFDTFPLDCYRSYSYAVSAYDADGNCSVCSDPAVFACRRFPFSIPWDDDETNSVADVSGLAARPAEAWVTVSNGHLTAGSEPIRFLGVNAVFGVCFPSNGIADKIAVRLAKLGVNCVRFHGMDNVMSPNGIFINVATNHPGFMRTLDAAQLDKLDYFVAKLKERGIYTDLNLHVNRDYPGYPTNGVPDNFKGFDTFMPGLVSLQREYARDLLTHVNPYTGNAYTNEPAVAFIEINNENGLIRMWHGGTFDTAFHTNYAAELTAQWNSWLAAKYTNTPALSAAWAGAPAQLYGDELLANGNFAAPFEPPWDFSASSPAEATAAVVSGAAADIGNALVIRVNAADAAPDAVRFGQGGVAVWAGQPYTLSFWSKSDRPRCVDVSLKQNRPLGVPLGSVRVSLGSAWHKHTLVITPSASEADGRLDVAGLGTQTGEVWFAGLSVMTGNTLIGPSFAMPEGSSGPEMLTNGNFSAGFVSPWSFQVVAPAAATKQLLEASAPDGSTALEINVLTNSTQGWHVQFYQGNLHITNNQPYTIAFWAKTEWPRTMTVRLLRQNSPWGAVSTAQYVSLATNWQFYTVCVTANATEYYTRLDMTGLGTQTGRVWFANHSVRLGTPGIGLQPAEALGTVGVLRKDQLTSRTRSVLRDWMRFMADTEAAYWNGMRDYIKNTLGAKALVVGTQTGYSPATIQAEMDVVDSHGYWQHPSFPGAAWDGNNWFIKNHPMAGLVGGGTFTSMAQTRVAGVPFICTEYNHPAPNTYNAETLPLLACYAALQGWDAIFAYNYLNDTKWEQAYYSTWFNCGREPAKLIHFPFAATVMRRGDVAVAGRLALASITPSVAFDKVALTDTQLGTSDFGINAMHGLQSRVALATGAADQLSVPYFDTNVTAVVSDTEELSWGISQKVVTVRAALAKAIIGDAGQMTYDLGHGVAVTPGATLQRNGWCVITLLVREGAGFQSAGSRILLTAAGYTDNHRQIWREGMGPTNATSMVAAANWGSAPTLMEGISAAVTLSRPFETVSVWALDERGRRKVRVPVAAAGDGAGFVISGDYQTAWYEVFLAATAQEAPFELWRAGHFSAAELADPAVSGDEADPDGDGLSNLFEYAIGSDPRGAGVGGRFTAALEPDGGLEYLTVTAQKNAAATDVQFSAEVSGDLSAWGGDVTVLQDDAELFRARDNTPTVAAPHRFLRTRVTRP